MRIGSMVEIVSYAMTEAKKSSSTSSKSTSSKTSATVPAAVSTPSATVSDSILSSLAGGSGTLEQSSAFLQMGKTTRALAGVEKRGSDLKTLKSNLIEMKELAATASSSTASDADKINAQVEFNRLKRDTKTIIERYVEPEKVVSKSKDTTFASLEADSSNNGSNTIADVFKDFSKLSTSSANISKKLDSYLSSVETKIDLNATREKSLYGSGSDTIGSLKMTISKNQRNY